jgi:subtilisin-like proprotein convertase family protein
MADSGHSQRGVSGPSVRPARTLPEVMLVTILSRLVALITGVSLVAGGLLLGSAAPSQAVFGAFTFPGSGFGPIADGTGACGTSPGAVRNVTFNVTDLPAGAPSDVRVTGLALTHPRVGEVVALLIAPNGDSHVLFGRTGIGTGGTGSGDNSNLFGPYSFADDAPGNWWTAAAAADSDTAIPSGAYRTSSSGGLASAGAVTSLGASFNRVNNPNGTWTLRFWDTCPGDVGAVTAATLELAPKCAPYEGAISTAQVKVATANAGVPSATAAAAAADAAVQGSSAAATQATQAVTKAKKALKKAKKSGDQDKIKRTKKKLAKAKEGLAAATAALATAQQNAAVAHQQVTSAQAAAIAAQAELIAAQSALAACKAASEQA